MVTQAVPAGRMRWIGILVIAAIAVAAAILADMQYQRAAQLSASLDSVRAQADQFQQQIGQLESQLEQARQPGIPVTVSFRSASAGQGLIAEFRNYSASEIQLEATVGTDPDKPKTQFNFVLQPLGSKDIGATEGAVFAVGQTLELTSQGFKPLDRVVQPSQ